MPRKLVDIDVDEITLCGSAANRKKFFIKKMEDSMKEFIEELKKFMAEDDEDIEEVLTKEDIEKAEKLSDNVIKVIKGALNILNKYKADMPDDVLTAIKSLAKYAAYDYGYPAKKEDKEDKEDLEKAGAKLSKTTCVQIQKALDHIKESPKAIFVLKTLLGLEVKKEEEGEEKTGGEERISPEIQAKLEKLAELEKAEKERLEKESEKKQKEDIQKMIDERLEQLELKEKPTKKSIDGQEDDEKKKGADDEEEDDYPSIPLLVKN